MQQSLAFISYYQKMYQADMNGKKTFIGYADWIYYTEEMSLEEIGTLFKAILDYQNGKEIGDMGTLKFVWSKIKNELSADKEKYKAICEQNSKKGKLHTGNQYTQGDTKWKAQKNTVEQMEQMEQDGTNGTNGTNGTHSDSDSDYKEEEDKSSSKKESIPSVSNLLDAIKTNPSIMHKIKDVNTIRPRLEYKQKKKSTAYKTVKGFLQEMVVMIQKVSNDEIQYDVDLRLQFAINQAVENGWKGLVWSEVKEKEYQGWLKVYNLTNKQNE